MESGCGVFWNVGSGTSRDSHGEVASQWRRGGEASDG